MARNARVAVQGGEPRKLPPPVRPGPAAIDLSEMAEVTIVVRSRGSDDEWQQLVAELTRGLPGERRYLTRAELSRKWGASPRDLEAVRSWVTGHRLQVVSADAFRRCVVVAGTLAQLTRAFGVELQGVRHPLGTFRTHREPPALPASLQPFVECILGLDNLPVARPHAAAAPPRQGMDRRALLDAYAIPTRLRGKGQCVAVIDLGGGYYEDDLTHYFGQFRLPAPRVIRRAIGGVKNQPAPRDLIRQVFGNLGKARTEVPPAEASAVLWTWETTTDLAMVGTIAPEASILLVQTTNDDQGQYHAITSVIADSRNRPSVLSCSWGGAEPSQTPSFMRAIDRWFQTAAVLGMSICCSSGDSGDGTMHPGAPANRLTAQFPASSPHVLACGGTTLHPKAGTEVAWKQTWGGTPMAGGGGFSDFFPLPAWQRAAGIEPREWIPRSKKSGRGRAIPDVAAKANLEQGYSVPIGGLPVPAGGSSAAAPLWAGLLALLNEGLQTGVGSLHGLLYDGTLSTALRDITAGNTGLFRAGKGWDPCTGWGSPIGKALLRVLRG